MLLLLPQGCNRQNPFPLKRLIFNTTTCFGNCPALHLELNSDTTFRLYVEHVWDSTGAETDWSRIGYYEGKVSDSSYSRILTQLQNLDLENHTWDSYLYHDAAFKELIVYYYPDERKSLASMCPPYEAHRLIESLYELCNVEEKARVNDTFHIEHDTSLWNILYYDIDYFNNPVN